MCGRFVSTTSPADLASYFDAEDLVDDALEPNWNVAPTDDVYVVRADGGARRVDAFRWGLVPFWAKSPSAGNKMINARAETVAGTGSYRHAFRRRRCLIPADGFYEWQQVPGQKQKQPYFVHRPDGEPYALAGLWETWRGADRASDERLRSCTIVTTTPNERMAEIHDRMPVILPATEWDTWLDPEMGDTGLLQSLLVPTPKELTVLRPVSTEVNSVRNTGPHLVEESVSPAVGDPPG